MNERKSWDAKWEGIAEGLGRGKRVGMEGRVGRGKDKDGRESGEWIKFKDSMESREGEGVLMEGH